jgi:hypothetical protein
MMGASRELAELASSYNSGGLSNMRNRIINGACAIDQRNSGASVTAVNGAYSLDRYMSITSQASKYSVQRVSDAPTGFINSLKATSLSAYSVTASDIFHVMQMIEGLNIADLAWGTANAATVTFSFWAKSSLTGTFGGSLVNSAEDRSYPFTYTISAANTWEYKSVTIPGDTTGTWLTTNGIGIRCHFTLGMGSNYTATAGAWTAGAKFAPTGAVSVVGTNGATLQVTGVQLERGSNATSFEFRDYGRELILCRRYFTKYYQNTTGAIGDTGVFNMAMWAVNSAYTAHWFQVSMRAGPSFSYSANSDFTLYSNGSTRTPSNITQQGSSADRCEITVDIATSLTSGNSSWLRITGTNGFIAWSAEL